MISFNQQIHVSFFLLSSYHSQRSTVPEKPQVYICMYRGQERIIPLKTNEYPLQKHSFCVVGLTFPFYHYSSLFRGRIRSSLEDLSQNTKVALKVVEKCSRGLWLAVRRYGLPRQTGRSLLFFFFGGGEGGGIYSIPSLQVENPQVFKP